MKITIRKIAELAGVSRSAVDKVIHNRPGVRPEIRKKVEQIIAETGYVPIHQQREVETALMPKTVAILMPGRNNTYFRALKQGIDDMTVKLPGLILEYYFCESTDIDGVLAALEFLEHRTVDLFVIRGMRSAVISDKLKQLGKPVIFIDSVVPDADMVCFIGEDCYQSGRLAASLLGKTVPKDGEIAVISGSPKVPGHKLRLEGFIDSIRVHRPDIRIVDQIYSQDQSLIAYERTCSLLDAYPRLCGICNLAGHAGEIGQAIIDRNRQGSVKLICYNITEDIAALLHRGVVEFSISIGPYRQGQLVAQVVYQYLLQGTAPAKPFIRTPISVILDENIELFLEDEVGPEKKLEK